MVMLPAAWTCLRMLPLHRAPTPCSRPMLPLCRRLETRCAPGTGLPTPGPPTCGPASRPPGAAPAASMVPACEALACPSSPAPPGCSARRAGAWCRRLGGAGALGCPPGSQVAAMGAYLGVRADDDDCLWDVARMALSAPLLAGWDELRQEDGTSMFRCVCVPPALASPIPGGAAVSLGVSLGGVSLGVLQAVSLGVLRAVSLGVVQVVSLGVLQGQLISAKRPGPAASAAMWPQGARRARTRGALPGPLLQGAAQAAAPGGAQASSSSSSNPVCCTVAELRCPAHSAALPVGSPCLAGASGRP